jgi:hypothetical protein
MCRIGAEGEGMLYIQQGIAKKKKSLRTHAHHYHGYHVPTEGKKKKKSLYGGYSDAHHAVLWYLVMS